jgi:exoribonuclease R
VHSREQLTYAGVQEMLDAGRAGESLELLREAGRLLRHAATARGAVTLNLPEQQVERAADGTWLLRFRAPLPVEEWNAEMSLLVGRCAARLMLDARVGLLRALPAPEPEVVESLRRSALALGVAWPDSLPNTAFVSALDPEVPAEAALSRLATLLVRGAHYVAFDGDRPVAAEHSGVAAPYAHATAPLRRLADRHVGVICAAVCAGREPPEWVRAALPALPEVMRVADHRAHALDRAVVDVAEAVLLQDRVGEVFEAVIVERKRGAEQQAEVQLREPAVRAPATVREAPLGSPVHVRLVEADPARRRVRFAGLVG